MKIERIAKTSITLLEEAILDALLAAKQSGTPFLDAGKISRQLGIPYEHEKGSGAPYYYIALGILHFLVSKGDVERSSNGQWGISEQGAARRGMACNRENIQ